MKGQQALEFLMNYGWAILIVVVVVASLFAMNVFNPSAFMSNSNVTSCQESFAIAQNECNVSCDCEFTCINVSTDSLGVGII